MPRLHTSERAFRISINGSLWLILLALADPRYHLLASYPKAYAVWLQYGTEAAWSWRLFVVCVIGFVALFDWGRMSWLVGFIGYFAQGTVYLCLGLMFAIPVPPETGISYLVPATVAYCCAVREAFR